MSAIDGKRTHRFSSAKITPRAAWTVAVIAGALTAVLGAHPAFGGQASTGKLAFYPCTQCHPVTVDEAGRPSHPLPIGMSKHTIELEVHDTLGSGDEACLACHDDPSRNPGMLLLPDGSLVDITGDVSRVCQRCHFEKYREWQSGVHGRSEPKCTASGCHDPHTPSWIYMAPLPPFQGTGVQIRAVSEREPFAPLAGPPLAPPVFTPLWLALVAGLGALVTLSIIGYLIAGRTRR